MTGQVNQQNQSKNFLSDLIFHLFLTNSTPTFSDPICMALIPTCHRNGEYLELSGAFVLMKRVDSPGTYSPDVFKWAAGKNFNRSLHLLCQ